jgi:hypothetical protein
MSNWISSSLTESRETVLIDPVLDYDAFSGTVKPDTAKELIEYVKKNNLTVTRIIDTHVHAVSIIKAIFRYFIPLKLQLHVYLALCLLTLMFVVGPPYGRQVSA